VKTAFVDVDTQLDFLYPAGALYVPGAEKLLPAIAALNRYAAAHGITVLSTADTHAENDPEFAQWPGHCIAGTIGQHKAEATLLERRAVMPSGTREMPSGAQQIIVQKHVIDVMQAANLRAAIDALAAERWVVYGVVTEYCVQAAAMGLLRPDRQVELVTDAVETLDAAKSREVLNAFTSAGGRLATVAQVLSYAG